MGLIKSGRTRLLLCLSFAFLAAVPIMIVFEISIKQVKESNYSTTLIRKTIFSNQTVNPSHVTHLISTRKCSHHYKILIIVTSHPRDLERRNIIRNTWAKDPRIEEQRWKTMFLMFLPNNKIHSKLLTSEINTFQDVVNGDLIENFYNLPLKLQMGFEWSVKYCSYDYLFKSDDDVFVNLPRLFEYINSESIPEKECYAGNVHFAGGTFREGKYAVTKEEYSKPILPRFCSGGGFILSRDVVERFIPTFARIPVFKLDDVYIGFLALKIGIELIHNHNFQVFVDSDIPRCKYTKRYIIHHPVKRSQCMQKLFDATKESDSVFWNRLKVTYLKNQNNKTFTSPSTLKINREKPLLM